MLQPARDFKAHLMAIEMLALFCCEADASCARCGDYKRTQPSRSLPGNGAVAPPLRAYLPISRDIAHKLRGRARIHYFASWGLLERLRVPLK